jgi:hypothetical protein
MWRRGAKWVTVETLGGGWSVEAALLPGEALEEAKARYERGQALERLERRLRAEEMGQVKRWRRER